MKERIAGDRTRASTLPDRPCRPGGVLLVGINPSPVSVAAGHYYQGTLGKRLWSRLRRVGLLPDVDRGWEDDAFVEAGNGLTDLVKRPTASAADLSSQELVAGKSALADKVREWRPGLLLLAYRPPAEALIGPSVSPGPCGDFDGISAFLMSPPYARSESTMTNEDLLRQHLGRDATGGSRLVARSPSTVRGPGSRSSERRRHATGLRAPTQRVTAADLARGQVRLPTRSVSRAKDLFPSSKGDLEVVVGGQRRIVHYDPRDGPDRERSGVLRVGRDVLGQVVREDEVLYVSTGDDGSHRLD